MKIYKVFEEAVCVTTDRISSKEVQNMYHALEAVYKDVEDYVRGMMSDREYYFEMYLPFRGIIISTLKSASFDSEDDELIYLPFMVCSIKVWRQLCESKDNPVFNLIWSIKECVDYIRNEVSNQGYLSTLPLTSEILSVHSFESIYKNALVFIGGCGD